MEGGREEKKWGGERERTEGKEAKPAYISEYNKKCVWGGGGERGGYNKQCDRNCNRDITEVP